MDYEVSEDKIKRAREYIEMRKKGINKKDALVSLGYSESTAKSPSLVEHTKAYAAALQQILSENTQTIQTLQSSVQSDIDNGKLDNINTKDKVDITLKLAQIHKILTPQVTIKEEQMKDGTTKRTVWGQGSVQGNTVEE